MNKNAIFYLLLWGFFTLTFTSCFKDDLINTDTGFELRFSTDSLYFDTTFTTVGSATKILKVYNDSNSPVEISNIKIRGNQGIHFTYNVDGLNGPQVGDIRINSNDSIYVFCKVRVDPDQPLSVSPFILEDYMDFEINSKTQSVVLVAWGQNANYITNRGNIGLQSVLTCQLQTITWDDPKPYVIYGQLVVDDCTLLLPPGTRVYLHGGIVPPTAENASYIDGRLIFINNGRLIINGSSDQPVTMSGDRLEREYKHLEGQWGGLAFLNTRRLNEINYLQMRNATFGILVDSGASLSLNNSIITDMVTSCLIARHANLDASNCLFANSTGHNVSLSYGGNYTFDYCTVANVSGNSFALIANNYACVERDMAGNCTKIAVRPFQGSFINSIFSGLDKNEVSLEDYLGFEDPQMFQFTFENSLIKGDSLQINDHFLSNSSQCKFQSYNDKVYTDENKSVFTLDSLSLARGLAKPLGHITTDITGKPRDPNSPDAGCYESDF